MIESSPDEAGLDMCAQNKLQLCNVLHGFLDCSVAQLLTSIYLKHVIAPCLQWVEQQCMLFNPKQFCNLLKMCAHLSLAVQHKPDYCTHPQLPEHVQCTVVKYRF